MKILKDNGLIIIGTSWLLDSRLLADIENLAATDIYRRFRNYILIIFIMPVSVNSDGLFLLGDFGDL